MEEEEKKEADKARKIERERQGMEGGRGEKRGKYGNLSVPGPMRIEYARDPVARIHADIISTKYITTRNVPISLCRPMGYLVLGFHTGAAGDKSVRRVC